MHHINSFVDKILMSELARRKQGGGQMGVTPTPRILCILHLQRKPIYHSELYSSTYVVSPSCVLWPRGVSRRK